MTEVENKFLENLEYQISMLEKVEESYKKIPIFTEQLQQFDKSVMDLKNKFDHRKTNFPLKGKHKYVVCNSCHKGNLLSKPAHNSCIDCHTDFHEGEFIKAGKITDCNQCHTEKGFSPSIFTLEQHKQTKFKLENAHMATPCNSCHLTNQKWKFRINGENCIDCHQNIHNEEISEVQSQPFLA